MPAILAIDQGTTSSRAIVFDEKGDVLSVSQKEFKQIYPENGWVEHDPEEIWQTTLKTCKEAIKKCGKDIDTIGITNQRETTIVWDRVTGKPIYNAIVWQDRRTADLCAKLKKREDETYVSFKTGLLLDPYFSATKIAWILDNVKGAKKKAKKGELAFGTVDCFLLWRLTGGKIHATDESNASRTLIYNINEHRWDKELLEMFKIPESMLPEVKNSADDFGSTIEFGKEITVSAIIGDQQAAAIGQGCIENGKIKSTYGTGCFVLINVGDKPVLSKHKMLTTVAYRINNKSSYAVEGSIFIAGAAINWLKNGLNIIESSSEVEEMVSKLDGNKGIYLVPAFTGLGAPHWNPNIRGAIFGLTRDTGRNEITRAALESVVYQTHDLLKAMREDGGLPKDLRVDGGMVKNDWFLQFLANILNINVERAVISETTALGAAFLAGLQKGIFSSLSDINNIWKGDKIFKSDMKKKLRKKLLKGWQVAVEKLI